jgi:hypothetical protein
VDAWNGIGIFHLREPRVRDVKFRVAFGLGDSLAQLGDFARADAESHADLFQPFVRSEGSHNRLA